MPAKALIRRLLYQFFPSLMLARASYARRNELKAKFWGRQRLSASSLYPDGRVKVLEGPFSGMLYIDEVVWGPIEPKWIGRYESEIQDIILNIIKKNYDTILDIGGADGYYSVGFGLFSPGSKIFSYDIDFISRRQQRKLAKINEVKNVEILGYCSHAEIKKRKAGKTLIFCDIEGFEYDLLDPAQCESLKSSDVLVELHSFGDRPILEVMESIKSRFVKTHLIDTRSTRTPDFHPIYKPSVSFEHDLLDEHRGKDTQFWLWMTVMQQ